MVENKEEKAGKVMSKSGDGLSSGRGFFWAFLILVVLPNLFFWLITGALELGRPLINVDYAFAAIFLAFNKRLLTVLVAFFAFFFDCLALVGQIFPVLHFSDVVYVSKFIGMAPVFYQWAIAVGCIVAIVMAWLSSRLRKIAPLGSVLAVINIVVFAYICQIFIGENRDDRVWRVADGRLIDSQIIFGIDSRNVGFVDSLESEGKVFSDVRMPGASSSWFSGEEVIADRVLLIVSESWGVSNAEIIKAVLNPIYNNRKVKNFRHGNIDFKGITIAAEMRELCQLYPNHFNFSESDDVLADCLPNKLREKGYSTFAMHGAAGLMYDRVKWYPKVGFEHLTFFESNSWERRCYSFPGACDSELMGRLEDVFKREGKVFSYWLTLNSHSRYDERDIEIDKFDCDKHGVLTGSQTCRNLKLHAQFFYNLAEIIDQPYMDSVEVIVVGDHEPPILSKKEKNQYFKRGVVPWLHFEISGGRGVAVQEG